MKFRITRTSWGEIKHPKVYEENGDNYVDINTFDEFINLQRDFGERFIVACDDYPEIEIYDDYRE